MRRKEKQIHTAIGSCLSIEFQAIQTLPRNTEIPDLNNNCWVFWVSVTFHVCRSVIHPAQNFSLFLPAKKHFHVMCHRTLEFKLQKIERKVTEPQKIKNMLAEIWTFLSRQLGFPYFTRSYLPRKIWKNLTFPRPRKSKFLCKHVNSYSKGYGSLYKLIKRKKEGEGRTSCTHFFPPNHVYKIRNR